MNRLRCLQVLIVLVVMLVLCGRAVAAERERISLVFGGDSAGSLELAAMKFQAPVLQTERFEFAGVRETRRIHALCADAIGGDAATLRTCQLRAANQSRVDQVLELTAITVDNGQYDVVLQVWSPESSGLLFGDSIEVVARSEQLAARQGFPQLADRYLCWRSVLSACTRAVSTAPVVSTTWSPLETPAPAPEPEDDEAEACTDSPDPTSEDCPPARL